MNRIKMLLLAFTLAACGGQAASDPEEPQSEEHVVEIVDGVPVYGDFSYGIQLEDAGSDVSSELGQAEQPLLFANQVTRLPGFVPDSEQGCTTAGGSAQNCIVPPMNGLRKGFVYYIEGGMGPRIDGFGVARFDVYSQLNQMWNDLKAQGAYSTGAGALNYRETSDINDPELTFIINVGGDFCTGPNVKGNVCFTGSTTEIPHDSSVVGHFHKMVNVPAAHLDYDGIRNHAGWTTAQKQRALHQAIVVLFLKGIGQGPKNISGSTRCDQNDVLTSFMCTLPPTAACKLNGWGGFGDDMLSLLGSCSD